MKVTKLSLVLAAVVASVSVGTIHAQTAKKPVLAKPAVSSSNAVQHLAITISSPISVRWRS